MAEPVSTSGGISLTVLFIAVLGPLAGPWTLIVFSALAGALWPLSEKETDKRTDGAWLLLRCTLTAVVLTGLLSTLLERLIDIRAPEFLGPVALLIGALGNGWRPVFASVGRAAQAFFGRKGQGGSQ